MLKKALLTLGLILMCTLLIEVTWKAFASGPAISPSPSADKINLALRRTGHQLLVDAGDSTTTIPPVEQKAPNVWLLRLNHPFNYSSLPAILQSSLELHGIHEGYDVAVLGCNDEVIHLGYSSLDFTPQKGQIPCGTRVLLPDCYDIKLTLAVATDEPHKSMPVTGWLFGGGLALTFFTLVRFKKETPDAAPSSSDREKSWITFGTSRLDVANLTLVCGSVTHKLTYREAKLLHLFVQHPGEVLERNFILEKVWADEGIQVSRSPDVFVSRLRKMLRDDPSVQLVAVHGVGYRLQVVSEV